MPATVSHTYPDRFTCRYVVEGDIAEVKQAVAELKENYHPCGYGTRTVSSEPLPGERVRVVVTRRLSCD